jgi:hypothetical protein
MKNLILKAVTLFTSAKVHATHTAIKGKKSSGKEDSFSSHKHWRALDGSLS